MKTISILLPTRNRPKLLENFINSVLATADKPEEIEFIVSVEHGDKSYKKKYPNTVLLDGGDKILADRYEWKHASGDIFMLANDDIIFHTQGWDTIVKRVFDRYSDKIVLVHGKDGDPRTDKIQHPFPFIHRTWVEIIGRFLPPYFSGDFVDTWLCDVANAMGRRVPVDIYTEHLHPAFDKREQDETDKVKWEKHFKDDMPQKYLDTLPEREQEIKKLKQHIHDHATAMHYICFFGHEFHESDTVNTRLGDLEVYQWRDFPDGGYCNYQDDVSHTLRLYGEWEKFESEMFEQLLDSSNKDSYILDVGSHIGWFSRMAENKGFKSIGFDGSLEHRRLFMKNCPNSEFVEMIFDKNLEGKFNRDIDVAVLKIDIEGAEHYAVKYFWDMLPRVKNILIEISPVFNDSYPETINSLINLGFKAYEIDKKPFDFNYDFPQKNLILTRETL